MSLQVFSCLACPRQGCGWGWEVPGLQREACFYVGLEARLEAMIRKARIWLVCECVFFESAFVNGVC